MRGHKRFRTSEKVVFAMEDTERTNLGRIVPRRSCRRRSRVLLSDKQAETFLLLLIVCVTVLWESSGAHALQNTRPSWTRYTAKENCFRPAFWNTLGLQTNRQRRGVLLYDSVTQTELDFLSTITNEQPFANGAYQPATHTVPDAVVSSPKAADDVANAAANIHGTHINGATDASDLLSSFLRNNTMAYDDAPRPTVNGGYTHTNASKAKISAANKGKTPWNKGRQRTPEERARIAAGVRARNRERFLQKLKDLGLTEEQYLQQKKEERRKKEAERRARRTENGGYRPTEETKKKISQILKEKYASGEVKPRKVDPAKVRRGFKHSQETKRKISESLRKRWADDEVYRANMLEKSTYANSKEDVRRRISDSLRKKWQDPEFRADMIAKMSNRTRTGISHGISHREKISRAMKAKWQDEEYRKKAFESIQRRKEARAKLRPPKPAKKKKPPKTKRAPIVSARNVALPSVPPVDKNFMVVQPITEPHLPKTRRKTAKGRGTSTVSAAPNKKTTKKKVPRKTGPKKTTVAKANPDNADSPENEAPKKKRKRANGDKSRLREERRDLYDLLYGDEDEVPISSNHGSKVFQYLGDENLDTFDPYGLEDF